MCIAARRSRPRGILSGEEVGAVSIRQIKGAGPFYVGYCYVALSAASAVVVYHSAEVVWGTYVEACLLFGCGSEFCAVFSVAHNKYCVAEACVGTAVVCEAAEAAVQRRKPACIPASGPCAEESCCVKRYRAVRYVFLYQAPASKGIQWILQAYY